MRVLVTGATGWIGSALVPELLVAGHEVVGLTRSDAGANALRAAGAEAMRGDLTDPAGLAAAAASVDGVVHLAFVHDFSDYDASVGTDQRAVAALTGALEGTGRPFVGTAGVLGIAAGRTATERDLDPDGVGAARAPATRAVLDAAEKGVRSSVVRLAPSVHGAGDPGFLATLVATARDTGVSGWVEGGRWPAVHRSDAARLYRLALEGAPAGSLLHGVAEEGVPVREVAEVVGRRMGLPVRPVEPDHFGWLGPFLAADSPASSALTRELLGWAPAGPGLLEDLAAGAYAHVEAAP
ncbi:SDR family oxidoreductase [Geodermatophilus nigrescens]|uniref:Nucleoside-diphosphate-sugar epimerase n=1 Tax=Geodermatophilus nigrescens TaxID=1070870 RepID=A0A1M5MBM5_9ACTN|nr:SDR family oxidoreductase [Geodermatophilus nigrescens]SHG74678.1 Nucleoside-diphosphate-sugar epimerase [Geodermatophilus nigrescens]